MFSECFVCFLLPKVFSLPPKTSRPKKMKKAHDFLHSWPLKCQLAFLFFKARGEDSQHEASARHVSWLKPTPKSMAAAGPFTEPKRLETGEKPRETNGFPARLARTDANVRKEYLMLGKSIGFVVSQGVS